MKTNRDRRYTMGLIAVVAGSLLAANAALATDVAIVAAAGSGSGDARFTDPRDKLVGTGRFNVVDIIDAGVVTPTLQTLQQYDAVIVWSNLNYLDSAALGNVLADYVDAGGGVVIAVFGNTTTTNNRYLTGRWSPDYDVIVPRGGTSSGNASLGTILDPNHPLIQGVSTFIGGSSGFRPTTTSLAPGSTLVAQWSDGKPLTVAGALPNRADIGFYPPSSAVSSTWWDQTTDGDILMANALEYVAGGGGGYRLTVGGACPGSVSVSWSGAEPGRQQGIVFGSREGSTNIPGGPCAGTVLGLQGNIQLVNTIGTGGGAGSVNGRAGTGACGGYLQLITLGSCAVSNTDQIP